MPGETIEPRKGCTFCAVLAILSLSPATDNVFQQHRSEQTVICVYIHSEYYTVGNVH